jgi:hypothetical protein
MTCKDNPVEDDLLAGLVIALIAIVMPFVCTLLQYVLT